MVKQAKRHEPKDEGLVIPPPEILMDDRHYDDQCVNNILHGLSSKMGPSH